VIRTERTSGSKITTKFTVLHTKILEAPPSLFDAFGLEKERGEEVSVDLEWLIAMSRSAEDDASPTQASAPGKMQAPEVIHIGRDRVELIWDPPLFIGGSAITAYSISAREGGEEGMFRTVHVTPDAERCEATVRPVPSKTWLEFTVAAVNNAGMGPPSRPSMPLLTYARRRARHRRRRGGSTASIDTLQAAAARTGSVRAGVAHKGFVNDAGADDAREDDWCSDVDSDNEAGSAAEPGDVLAAGDTPTQAYERVKAQLAALEAQMSASLGRRVLDEELAASASYRNLARELVRLRELRDAHVRAAEAARAKNREWMATLQRLGFEAGSRLRQLELELVISFNCH